MGVDPLAVNRAGHTPLVDAASTHRPALVKVLLDTQAYSVHQVQEALDRTTDDSVVAC